MEIVAAELWEYDQKINVKTWEFIILPVYIFLISIISYFYQQFKIFNRDYYKYFTIGLLARLFGAISFALVYLYYYGGGDTTSYFESSKAMANLFYKNPVDYFTVLFSPPSNETRSLFTIKTGYPWSYLFYDSHTFMVVKLTSIITIITFKSYILTSVILATITYYGVWKVFSLFVYYFPIIEKKLAFSILYFPSTLFWGSGVSKDTYTYLGVFLLFFSVYNNFIN
ncbi:MAG: hypothetical protein ACK4ON_06825, partial [Bacteroidia bacterium]